MRFELCTSHTFGDPRLVCVPVLQRVKSLEDFERAETARLHGTEKWASFWQPMLNIRLVRLQSGIEISRQQDVIRHQCQACRC